MIESRSEVATGQAVGVGGLNTEGHESTFGEMEIFS